VQDSTGWSSIPFGETPIWPWTASKYPTPVIVADPLSLVNELDEIDPQSLSTAERTEAS
jgi:hypothetical protein